MRIAHLILTYTDPHQTERMIKRLSRENFDFYIHVDKKFDIQPHLFLSELPNVYFIKNRTKVDWAGFSTVMATISCIREIAATGIRYDFINFLSGQDYPIKSAGYINDFLARHPGKQFLYCRDIINEWQEGLIRLQGYYLTTFDFRGKYLVEKLINKILPKRKIPYGLHPYGGSMFWMLSMDAALHVADRMKEDKKLRRFFSFCWGSDEVVFQTILMNSTYKNNVINDNYRYIDWSMGGANPKILNTDDAEKLLQSDMLFARKFNINTNPEILDIIDEYITTNGEVNSDTNIQR
ncbi:beta-1,6-N-acetylglucosaminyltransferase [Chitinophaga sp. 212800010-3]|uniref:beta-1,6-N-acetylglucosaminyltransferase n=1 Tax=unclassified Chitinophaga TaxID=2619133 RepID=UPI002DED6B8E|nr:Core-2/I-Branching enzyme [Chitinophaga sp. 212800010-3]